MILFYFIIPVLFCSFVICDNSIEWNLRNCRHWRSCRFVPRSSVFWKCPQNFISVLIWHRVFALLWHRKKTNYSNTNLDIPLPVYLQICEIRVGRLAKEKMRKSNAESLIETATSWTKKSHFFGIYYWFLVIFIEHFYKNRMIAI